MSDELDRRLKEKIRKRNRRHSSYKKKIKNRNRIHNGNGWAIEEKTSEEGKTYYCPFYFPDKVKFAKKLSKRAVRRYKHHIPNGNWYHKIENIWNIIW